MSDKKYGLHSPVYDMFNFYGVPRVQPGALSRSVMELMADYSLQISGVDNTYVRRPTKLYTQAASCMGGARCKKFFDKFDMAKQLVQFLGSKKYKCSWASIDKDNKHLLSVCGIYAGAKYVVCYNGKQQEIKVNVPYENPRFQSEYDVGEAIFHTITNFEFLAGFGIYAKKYLNDNPDVGKWIKPEIEQRIAKICNEIRSSLEQKTR